MTPTREQYELAAKAAGGMLYYDTELVVRFIPPGTPLQFNVMSLPQWRPHKDRSDAFSLQCAIKGGLWFEEQRNAWYACLEPLKGPPLEVTIVAASTDKTDIEAAAREAIFLCAVEVGRGMA